MKKAFLFINLILICTATEGIPSLQPDSSSRQSVGLSSSYYFTSNAITNRFASAYFFHEFIDDEMKDEVSENLSEENRFGTGFWSEAFYSRQRITMFGLPNSGYTVKLGIYHHIYSRFSYDAFELYFRGNKSYAGKTGVLNNFLYNFTAWQQLNFTFNHEFSRNENKVVWSVGIGLNKGSRLQTIEAQRASIYTETDGMYLDLDADIELQQSDSTKKQLISWNGTGASLDFNYSITYSNQNKLSFTVKNFGFVNWNDQTAFVTADTSYRFEGIDVSDLFILSDSVEETVSLDSSLIEPYLSERTKKAVMIPLPALMQVSYQYVLTPGKSDVEAGIRYLLFAASLPEGFLTYSHSLKNVHQFSARLSYGGYTGFNAGLGYKLLLDQKWMFTIQSDYITGMIDPHNGTAQGTFVSLTSYF